MGVYYLESYLRLESQKQARLEKEKEQLGNGKLHIRRNGEKMFFREYRNGIQYGITKNKKRVYQLARKDIVEEKLIMTNSRIKTLEAAIKNLNSFEEKTRIDKVLERYNMLEVERLLLSDYEARIYNNRFSQNPFNKESLIYKTEGTVAMRSKSERFIGSFLENEKLLYMYEPEMVIDGKNIYPDFVIFRPDGRKVIWEHCGLMNDTEYYNKMIRRLEEYRKIGYVQHKNLICTYEEDLQNIETLRDIVRRFVYT